MFDLHLKLISCAVLFFTLSSHYSVGRFPWHGELDLKMAETSFPLLPPPTCYFKSLKVLTFPLFNEHDLAA